MTLSTQLQVSVSMISQRPTPVKQRPVSVTLMSLELTLLVLLPLSVVAALGINQEGIIRW
jgi:hypothetical protein